MKIFEQNPNFLSLDGKSRRDVVSKICLCYNNHDYADSDVYKRQLYLLESRSHSRKELFDKLCRSVPEQTAAEVTQRMEDLGLVDDEAYARRWAAMLWREKKYGPRRIRQSLTQKGFDRELIDQVMEEMAESFADEEAAQQLETLICRKYARHLADVYKRQTYRCSGPESRR